MTWEGLVHVLEMAAPANIMRPNIEAHADSMFKNPVGGIHAERTPEQLARSSAARPVLRWMADWCSGIISAIGTAVDTTRGEVSC